MSLSFMACGAWFRELRAAQIKVRKIFRAQRLWCAVNVHRGCMDSGIFLGHCACDAMLILSKLTFLDSMQHSGLTVH